jgi:hypothetical protein
VQQPIEGGIVLVSYFCLVPHNALGDEHLTLVWCGKGVGIEGSQYMHSIAARLTEQCPAIGVPYEYATFGYKEVVKVALGHKWHKMRIEVLERFDASDFIWDPHITLVPNARVRPLGVRIGFNKVEWRA